MAIAHDVRAISSSAADNTAGSVSVVANFSSGCAADQLAMNDPCSVGVGHSALATTWSWQAFAIDAAFAGSFA